MDLRSTEVHGFPHFGQLHWFPDPFPFLSLPPTLEEKTLLQLLSCPWYDIPWVAWLESWGLAITAKAGLLSLEPRMCNLLTVENLQPDFMHSEINKNNYESWNTKLLAMSCLIIFSYQQYQTCELSWTIWVSRLRITFVNVFSITFVNLGIE